jgi:hypothetical protein
VCGPIPTSPLRGGCRSPTTARGRPPPEPTSPTSGDAQVASLARARVEWCGALSVQTHRPGSIPSSLFMVQIEVGSPLRTMHASGNGDGASDGSKMAAADPGGKGGTTMDGPAMCSDSVSRGYGRDRGGM